jgi:S1-C subfamily serine protease
MGLGLWMGAMGALAEEPAERHFLRRIDSEFVAVFEKVAPAVVVVEARKPPEEARGREGFSFRDDSGELFPMPRSRAWSEGSGFVIASDGLIVTNQHVVDGAAELFVRMRGGRRLRATLAGTDERTDIAVLRVDGDGLDAVEFGDSDSVKVGQLVCAIGVPYQLDYSFTCGWVSGVGRTNLTDTNFEDYIQTDAFINPGNSGGPLFDVEGRVIGMNTLIRGLGRGLSFAIPANLVRGVSGALAREGRVRRPWIGVRVEGLDRSDLAQLPAGGIDRGVVVHTIFPESPALQGDIRPADVLLAVDGVELRAARDLQREIYRKPIGQRVVLSIWRGNRRIEAAIVTAELPRAGEEMREMPGQSLPRGEGERPTLHGLEFQELPQGLADQIGIKGAGGVLVAAVASNSPASKAGFSAGDVILAINRADVSKASDVGALLGKASLKAGALVEYDRHGMRRYAVLYDEDLGAAEGRGE